MAWRGIGGIAAVVAFAGPAQALDWTLSGFFSQRAEVEQGDDDVTFGSVTDLGVSAVIETPRTRLQFAPGVRLNLYRGGDDETDLTPRFNGSLTHRAPRDTLSASLSLVPERTSSTAFEETDRASEDALQITLSGQAGWTRRATNRDTLSLDANLRLREFDGASDSLEASQAFGLDGRWRRAVDNRGGVSLILGYDEFRSDGEGGDDTRTFSTSLGVDRALTPRLNADARLGLTYVSVLNPDPGEDDSSVDLTGGFGISYQGLRTSASLDFSQAVDQNADGDVENRSQFSGALRRRLDTVSSVELASGLSFATPVLGGDDDVTFTLRPSYNRSLDADWSIGVGYALRMESGEDGETSHLGFVSISRGLSFLP